MAPYEGRELAERLAGSFVWRTDRGEDHVTADLTGWWRDPRLLASLGPALAGLYDTRPTVVLGPQSRGSLLGALVAAHLGAGLVEARKNPGRASDSDEWRRRTTPPDHRDRHVVFGFRGRLVRPRDRVLLVDDWAETGATATACRGLVADAGAEWVGAAVVVDALDDSRMRRDLPVRSLLHLRDLP
jgi:adenine phosphoribosyltransferase